MLPLSMQIPSASPAPSDTSRRCARTLRDLQRGGIVGVQCHPIRLDLVLEDASLRGRMVLDRRVTIEVIGEVEKHGHPRMKRLDRFELEAARFDHVNRVRGRVVYLRAQGIADVPAHHLQPPASSIRPVSVVVVDLPLVPVIATIRPDSHRDASSSSPMIVAPAARAASIAGCRSGTPGLITTRSASVNVRGVWPPSWGDPAGFELA